MAYTTYISNKFIVQEVINATGMVGNIDEDAFYIAADTAVDKIITGDNYKTYVILLNLYNNKAQLPNNFRYPLQVAYRPIYNTGITLTDLEIRQKIACSLNIGSDIEINTDINTCKSCLKSNCTCEEKIFSPIEITPNYKNLANNQILADTYANTILGYSKYKVGVEEIRDSIDKSNYQLIGDKSIKGVTVDMDNQDPKSIQSQMIVTKYSRSNICPAFTLVRPTSNYLFNLPGRINECNIPTYDTNLEYNIDDKIIELNAYIDNSNWKPNQEGQVLISYLGRRIDNEGFLMVPNEPYIVEAIKYFVIAELAFTQYSITKEMKDERYWKNTLEMATIRMRQAKSRFRMANYDEWEMFVENHWLKRIPYRDYKRHNNRSRQDLYRLPNETWYR